MGDLLDNFFEGNRYYDYPSFQVALYSLLLALVLGSVIAYTYKSTQREGQFSKDFFQAMVLSSLVTSMIMMAVGSNLAVGFGIIGAVAIIRFRTNLQNPRNIIFIFAALAVGIATGVYGYAIALAGTLIFSGTAVLLHYSPFGSQSAYQFEVTCQVSSAAVVQEIIRYLKDVSTLLEETEIRTRENEQDNRYQYLISLRPGQAIQDVFEQLRTTTGVTNVRIIKRKIVEQL